MFARLTDRYGVNNANVVTVKKWLGSEEMWVTYRVLANALDCPQLGVGRLAKSPAVADILNYLHYTHILSRL